MLYYEIFASQLQQNIYAIYVLFGWGVVNLIFGTIQLIRHKRSTQPYYFYLMSMCWGVVNTGIAIGTLAYLSSINTDTFGLTEIIYTGFTFEKTVLANIGLNIAYIAIGAFLVERGKHLKKHLYKGFGHAIWLQGGFLFIFDTVLFLLNYMANQEYRVFILF
ncbi:MAG: DUF6992 family protein [Patescibacteria group bacterium]